MNLKTKSALALRSSNSPQVNRRRYHRHRKKLSEMVNCLRVAPLSCCPTMHSSNPTLHLCAHDAFGGYEDVVSLSGRIVQVEHLPAYAMYERD